MQTRRAAPWLSGLALVGALAAPAGARIIEVNSTADAAADDGMCTLREALTSANENTASGSQAGECTAGEPVYPGRPLDVIHFRLAGTGPFIFNPATPLPFVREAVFIDGYSQPGALPNRAPVGNDAVIQLELRGDSMAEACDPDGDSPLQGAAFQFVGAAASGSRLRGFAITGFSAHQIAVFVFRTSAVQIDGNFVGFDTTGTPRANGPQGVWVANGSYKHIVAGRESVVVQDGSAGNLIGGSTPEERNVIAGAMIALMVGGQRNRVEGNYLGVEPQGLKPEMASVTVQTGEFGIASCTKKEGFVFLTADNTIGGTRSSQGNLIVPGSSSGLQLAGARDRVQGNLIGTDRTGGAGAGSGLGGNRAVGVVLASHANGALISGNVIAFNTTGIVAMSQAGVSPSGNDIHANSIFSNAGLGIDLEDDGVTGNDSDDTDAGSNGLQNFPENLFATTAGVRGDLRGKPDQLQRIDFFQSASCDPSGNGEGTTYVGSTSVFTDLLGRATFGFAAGRGLTVERFVSATATSSDGTSELSGCAMVVPAAAAQVLVSSSKNPARSHDKYAISVRVRGSGGKTPQGSVTLRDANSPQPLSGGGTGFFAIGSESLTPIAGTDDALAVIDSAKIQLPGRAWGNVRILADYSGDSAYVAARAPELVQGIYREKSDFDGDGLTDLLLCDSADRKFLVPGKGATSLVRVPQLDMRTVLGTGEFGPAGFFGSWSFPGALWRDANGKLGGTLFGGNAPWADFDLKLPQVPSQADPNVKVDLQLEALGPVWGTTSDDFVALAERQHYALLTFRFQGSTLELYDPWKVGPPNDYLVERTGDFDGDGNLDWHFRHPTDPGRVLWLLDGKMNVIGGNFLAYQPPGGVLEATGDFDGDGRADHLWRRMDGSFELVMQDGIMTKAQMLLPLAVGEAVVGTAFFDDGSGSSGGRSSLVVRGVSGGLEAWVNTGVAAGLPVFGRVLALPTGGRTDLRPCVP